MGESLEVIKALQFQYQRLTIYTCNYNVVFLDMKFSCGYKFYYYGPKSLLSYLSISCIMLSFIKNLIMIRKTATELENLVLKNAGLDNLMPVSCTMSCVSICLLPPNRMLLNWIEPLIADPIITVFSFPRKDNPSVFIPLCHVIMVSQYVHLLIYKHIIYQARLSVT